MSGGTAATSAVSALAGTSKSPKSSIRIGNNSKSLLLQQNGGGHTGGAGNGHTRKKTFQSSNNNLTSALDDIKYIDSEDCDRQSKPNIRPLSQEITGKTTTHTYLKQSNGKFLPATSHGSSISLKTSTLPLTNTKQRKTNSITNLQNTKVTNEITNHGLNSAKQHHTDAVLNAENQKLTNKYNALHDLKRMPVTNVRNFNSINNGGKDLDIFIGKSITRPMLNNLKKSKVIVSEGSQLSKQQSEHEVNDCQTTINGSTLSTIATSHHYNKLIPHNNQSVIGAETGHSKESSPSNSPQLIRSANYMPAIIDNSNIIAINNAINSMSIHQQQQQTSKTAFLNTNNCDSILKNCQIITDIRELDDRSILFNMKNCDTIIETPNIITPPPSPPSKETGAPEFVDKPSTSTYIDPTVLLNNDKNLLLTSMLLSKSNNKSENEQSIRNTSIRNAVPSSPTRYYRDGTSVAPSRYITTNDNDDYHSSSKIISSSESYDKYDKNDKSGTEGLCGLRNIGNTCFMNSVIQCLSHTRELTKFLKTQTYSKSSPSKDQQILCEFAKLIREMWTQNVHSVTPLELKSAFSSKHRMYSGYNQQDAQEFLRFFLDSLHSALNSGGKGELLKIDDTLSDNKIADLTWDWYAKIENSVVRDLFVGQLKSSLKCTTCGNTSVTFDPFWDLSVPLPSSSRCKLDACLDLFIREEILDGDEMPTCSKCKTRRKCTKTFTIQRFPKYLVIHLKRFSETRWSKLSNIVEFPTGDRELNMAPYAANSNTNCFYTLYAISNHMGSTAGGHYVALCKHPNSKKWHEFNDNVVSDDLSDNVLVSSSAYLLFYERA